MEKTEPEKKALLVLEDGSVFRGDGFGAEAQVSGEVVFNTSMTGYPEVLTDPSYQEQIVIMTYPILGSYGIPSKSIQDGHAIPLHFESDSVKVKGFGVHSLSRPSHWSNKETLDQWLSDQGIPGISGVDTRALTQRIRNKGTLLGILVVSSDTSQSDEIVRRPFQARDPNQQDLVRQVSTKEPVHYKAGGRETVVVVDCGVKYGILRHLLVRGVDVVRVPYDYSADRILKFNPAGIVVSNGPGDPRTNTATIESTKALIETRLPILGICLGAQIIALAAGAETYKLKFGHRAVNHPCMDLQTGKCYITTQNHGYTVKQESLDGTDFVPSFININDKTVEGIRHNKKPITGIQWHPENSPGPHDTEFLFDRFLGNLNH